MAVVAAVLAMPMRVTAGALLSVVVAAVSVVSFVSPCPWCPVASFPATLFMAVVMTPWPPWPMFVAGGCDNARRHELHSALGAAFRRVAHHLRMHRADERGLRGGRCRE